VVKATDEGQNLVWDAQRKPFGQRVVSTELVEMPLGFPGQYFDQESNNYYNYFRDYDPATGRYLQSDPIGLDGGINTYSYALNNPLLYIDIYGLDVFMCWGYIRTYPHARLCVDNNCAGLMPWDSCPDGGMVLPEEFDEDQCIEIEPHPDCDQDVYEQCLKDAINNRECTKYNIVTRNCIQWGNETHNRCSRLACKK
jgi:RHS repeat-associated protein